MSVDWTAIRADYENGLSLRQLAEKYSVSKSVIGERKFKEQWDKPRTDTRTFQETQGIQKRDVLATNRVSLALELRAKKLTYDEIAKRCGYSSAGACYKAIQRELNRVVSEKVEELRREESYILDILHGRLFAAAMDEKNKDWQWAADRVLNLSKARRELLGLDKLPDDVLSGVTVIRNYGVEVSRV